MSNSQSPSAASVRVGERNRIHRAHERGRYDRAFIDAVLDASVLCHLGFIDGDRPVVTPTVHWRDGDHVYWHGANAARYIKATRDAFVCLTVTHLDGLVLARSAFHHSANYRSVMLHGRSQQVTDVDQKVAALEAMIEKLYPGRWAELRPMNAGELAGTTVLRVAIDEASAKARSGHPVDDEPDYALPIWAGTVPMSTQFEAVVPDPRLQPGVAQPAHVDTIKDRLG